MIKRIAPLIFLLAALGLFFLFITPRYEVVKAKRGQIKILNDALLNSRKVQAARDTLLTTYNNISNADLERLKRILPDHVDNVRLILEINRIATDNGMILQNVTTRDDTRADSGAFGPDDSAYGKIRMSFSLAGKYESLVNFLKEIEQSLRVVDIVALSFTRGRGDLYEYEIEVDTYWLKSL